MDTVHDKETGGGGFDDDDDDDQRRLLGRCGIPVESGNGLLSSSSPPPDDQQQNHNHNQNQKKQVRRRLHTSRPYQERLLNMAEARREIVAALKFHRATMKQSSSSNRRQQQQEMEVTANLHIPNNLPPPPPTPTSEEEEINQAYYSNHAQTSSGNSCGSINSCCSYFLQQQQQQPPSYLWPSSSSSSISPSSQFGYSPFPFSTIDNLHDFPLPSQTLGLNLNFHQFANMETPVCRQKFVSETSYPQWQQGAAAVVQDHEVKVNPVVMMDVKMNNMTPVYQESESTTIGSDEHNLLKSSAWWFNRFKSTMEPKQEKEQELYCNNYLFDETVNGVDVPNWLSSEEESCFHEIDHTISQDHLLPSMDIGEIETIDGDWLS